MTKELAALFLIFGWNLIFWAISHMMDGTLHDTLWNIDARLRRKRNE